VIRLSILWPPPRSLQTAHSIGHRRSQSPSFPLPKSIPHFAGRALPLPQSHRDAKGDPQIEPGVGSRLGFEESFGEIKEDVAMIASSESEGWLDRWWPLLVILYGLIFVTILVTFAPTT
jgi:hypothetical protein